MFAENFPVSSASFLCLHVCKRTCVVCVRHLWISDVSEDWLGHSMTVTSCLALQPTHWHLFLFLSWPVLGFFLPFPSSSLPSLEHWSFSLQPPLKGCGVFVQPDKGCHSSPFPLLCGPGLAAPVEVQMVSSWRGYPRGPLKALSLLQAWLITTLPPPPPSFSTAPRSLEPRTTHSHNQHLAFFSPGQLWWWHPSPPLPSSSSSFSFCPTHPSQLRPFSLSLLSLSLWLSLIEVLNCFLTLTNCSCWKGRCQRGKAADANMGQNRWEVGWKFFYIKYLYFPLLISGTTEIK